ncbi:MAG: CBS domain-containing protein [Elusimicrobia bacterium]|nr:CBS domain-containing protein [Elusimicrobiota bacterium]
MTKAKDIMRRHVVTVDPRMTVREVAALFIDREISGAPVIDGKGDLVGVVSQTDLVRRERESRAEVEVPGYYRDGETSVYISGYQVKDPDFTRVGDVMTPAVISADEETPVEELAKMMLKRHIHRIIITRSGNLSGIVTSTDMVRTLLAKSTTGHKAAKA